jgi:hypothetical protein
MMEASRRPTLVSPLVEHKRLEVFKLELRLSLSINVVYKHFILYLSCTQVCMHTTMGPQTVENYKSPQNSRRQKGDTKKVPYLRHTNIRSYYLI